MGSYWSDLSLLPNPDLIHITARGAERAVGLTWANCTHGARDGASFPGTMCLGGEEVHPPDENQGLLWKTQ